MQTRKPLEKTISYLIAGHHAGLPDWYAGSGKSLKSILANNDYDRPFRKVAPSRERDSDIAPTTIMQL